MIKQNFVIVCESAVIDKDSNNSYILGVFDNIIAPNLPAVHPRFAVVTNFDGEIGKKHPHVIKITDPSGDEIASLPGEITFELSKKAQYIGRFIGVRFDKYGEYKIEIFVDGLKQAMSAQLEVIPK